MTQHPIGHPLAAPRERGDRDVGALDRRRDLPNFMDSAKIDPERDGPIPKGNTSRENPMGKDESLTTLNRGHLEKVSHQQASDNSCGILGTLSPGKTPNCRPDLSRGTILAARG